MVTSIARCFSKIKRSGGWHDYLCWVIYVGKYTVFQLFWLYSSFSEANVIKVSIKKRYTRVYHSASRRSCLFVVKRQFYQGILLFKEEFFSKVEYGQSLSVTLHTTLAVLLHVAISQKPFWFR